MTSREHRDKMAEEYGQKSRDMGFSRGDSESGFIHGYDEAKRSDPDVVALVKSLIDVIDGVGLTHYEDCDHYDDERSLCSCGVHKFEMAAREALEPFKESK